MIELETITRRWEDKTVVVAATGPSLIADVPRADRIVAVNDAYRLLPHADILYAADAAWWRVHDGCPSFAGEKWSVHDNGSADKRSLPPSWGLRLVAGRSGNVFSQDPAFLTYGSNSGFQAVNLAMLLGARRVILCGFDMRVVEGNRHFFGDHPQPLRNTASFGQFIDAFEHAGKQLPAGVEIVNATPGSALQFFPEVDGAGSTRARR